MKTSGIQIVAELNGCQANMLNDEKILEQMLNEGIKLYGFHLVTTFSHKYDPIGVTVISIISESQIVIHTYPEANHASVDIFHLIQKNKLNNVTILGGGDGGIFNELLKYNPNKVTIVDIDEEISKF